MAPRFGQMMDNPMTLHTRKAMRVLGRLIAEWSLDPDSRPADAKFEADGRVMVIQADSFRKLLMGQPDGDALSDQDFALRAGIAEVELILRRPDRFSILLPESEALAHQAQVAKDGFQPRVRMARLYLDIDAADASRGSPVNAEIDDETTPANYDLVVDDKALDAFLHPHMAAYCCTQCT